MRSEAMRTKSSHRFSFWVIGQEVFMTGAEPLSLLYAVFTFGTCIVVTELAPAMDMPLHRFGMECYNEANDISG